MKEFLLKSCKEPLPEWAENLHITPIEYTKSAGWTLDENGEIVKLYFDEIIAFERSDKKEMAEIIPIKTMTETCGYCSKPLVLIFDGTQKFATCFNCSCYEAIFFKEENGKIFFHEKNYPKDFLKKHPEYIQNDGYDLELTYYLKPSSEKRRASYTANQFAEEISKTQIGGKPTEINYIYYPKCLDCEKVMCFAAQFDVADVREYGEGIYYFFVCEKCKTVAVNYDQT